MTALLDTAEKTAGTVNRRLATVRCILLGLGILLEGGLVVLAVYLHDSWSWQPPEFRNLWLILGVVIALILSGMAKIYNKYLVTNNISDKLCNQSCRELAISGFAWLLLLGPLLFQALLLSFFSLEGNRLFLWFADDWMSRHHEMCEVLFYSRRPSMLLALVCAWMCFAGAWRLCRGLRGLALQTDGLPEFWSRTLPWLCLLFPPAAGLLPLGMHLLKRRWRPVGLAMVQMAVLGVSCWGFSKLLLDGWWLWGLAWLQVALFAWVVAGLPEAATLRWRQALRPSAVALAVAVVVLATGGTMRFVARRHFTRLEEYAGVPLDRASVLARLADGLTEDAPELAAFARCEFTPPTTGCCQMLEEFLLVPPQPLACWLHSIDNSLLVGVLPPEYCARFRTAAKYVARVMAEHPGDWEKIGRCNAAMLRLREWMLVNVGREQMFFGVAHGIEGIRLNALLAALVRAPLAEEAWRELVGEEPQWTAYYPATVGMAAATVMDFWNWLPRALHYSRPREDALALNFSCIRFQQLAPFLAEVLSAREQHRALELLEEYAAGGPVAVKWHRAERSSQEVDFQLLLDEIGVGLVQRMAVLAEKLSMQRHAALMAWKVIDFQRRTGRFPRDLQEAGASEQEAEDFGYAAIVASTDHAPGFRIFAREGGEVKVEHWPTPTRNGIFVEYPPELSSH